MNNKISSGKIRRRLLLTRDSTKDKVSVDINGCYLYCTQSVQQNIDAVFLAPKDYELIFGFKKAKMSLAKKRLSVIRISFDGKHISRRYLGESKLKCTECAALNYSSLLELVNESSSEVIGHEVTLSKGSRFDYYWNHPFHATRISFRLGIISIALAVISIFISFCAL